MTEIIEKSFIRLTNYCEKEDFKGYDPFDGLNSRFFRALPFIPESRFARLAWIQFFKRSPLNLRKIAGVKKDYNPKAIGLFLSGYCNLYKQSEDSLYMEKIKLFSGMLLDRVNNTMSGACWGYNFDWQSRAFFQPENTPTVVTTTFIGNALLDAYGITGEKNLLSTARSACDFINKDLNRNWDDKGNFAFSYSPLDKTVVFNASLLAAHFLARVYSLTREKELLDNARRSVAYCCDHQRNDGSWSYGTLDFHQWIDSFHTGYNLECLAGYLKYTGDESFTGNLATGFDYYLKNFFTDEGIPKYYNNSIYPVDVHTTAQLIVTLSRLGKLYEYKSLADKVLIWTIKNMQSEKGFFYYQKNKYFTSRIPYMRWAQAWMFYAMSEYLSVVKGTRENIRVY
jgi:rhamnogalacturonyl hydrolase YesR